jgi:hypothetical protein
VSETRKILPDGFDWVTERHKCLPSNVLDKLRMQIEQDVEKRKELMSASERTRLNFFIVDDGRQFIVKVEGQNHLYRAARFGLTPNGIVVHDPASGKQLHEATLTLSDDGECRLRIGEREYDLWQFRKLVLHDIFFGNDVIYGKMGLV